MSLLTECLMPSGESERVLCQIQSSWFRAKSNSVAERSISEEPASWRALT